jgi:uncharacterized protein (DUF58 family)
MNTDLVKIERDEDMLKKRRLWYVLALGLLFISVVTRQPLAFLAALFTVVVAFVPELWYRRALRHLVVRQWVDHNHLFFGEVVTLSMRIENQKWLPLPWLAAENTITPPLAPVNRRALRLRKANEDTFANTWLLWSFQRVTRRYRFFCHARGFHVFGPIRLRSSDPFGWLECDMALPVAENLLIYPLIAPLETLGFASVHPFGDYASDRRLIEDPLRFAGVREYQLGDDPRRIHWKATARTHTLQSKLYEPSSLRRLLVLLDAWNYSEDLKEADVEIQELTISVAASLALWGLDNSYMVGLLSNSSLMTSQTERPVSSLSESLVEWDIKRLENATSIKISAPGVSVPFASDYGQYERILSHLARLVPRFNTPIEHIMDTEDTMFPLGTTVVLVSAKTSLNAATIERLLDLRARGAAVYLVLTGEPDVDLATDIYDLPLHYVGGKEKWHELISTVGEQKSETVGTSSTALQLD